MLSIPTVLIPELTEIEGRKLPIRRGRSSEVYQLQCHACGKTIQIPTGQRPCSRCGQDLVIEWEEGRRAIEDIYSQAPASELELALSSDNQNAS